ncbi:50S ribosomal protein L21 [Candidatus Parcubacteria bacterium]|nr:50S ribosomal protein L21 [Candidatus Parcubacteria bacterium]
MAEATIAKKKAPAKAPKAAPKASKKALEGSTGGFAVIMTGGKQYRVTPGMKLKIEKLLGDHKEGDSIVFRDVLMKDDGAEALTLGMPTISGATVTGTITKISRYKTVDVIKYKQKSRYFKKYGHRQPYFEVTINSIA